jgi:polyisoprenoid-binding protein YceI
MTVKSVVVALGILASAGLAAGAQSKTTKKPAKAPVQAPPANLHFTVAPTGNEARYRVREQLVGIDFPTDAIGKAHDITGMLIVQPNGTIVSDSSRITINVQTLKSDKSGRDKTLKTSALETNEYPTVQFVPKSFTGLTAKPGATAAAFTVAGDLTVHGATHPVTWNVNAHSDGNDVVGTATTQFTFQDIGIDPPKKPILLIPVGVADTIKLEYDFHFIQAPPQ